MNAKHYFIIIVLFVLSCVAAMAETTQQFVKVTDASTLADGDEIIFANTQFQVALGVANSSVGRWKAVPVKISDGILIPTDETRRFVLERNKDKFYFKSENNKYFIDKDGFVEGETSKTYQDWTVICCEDSAYVVFNKTKRKLNFKLDTKLFSCYLYNAQYFAVSIFKKSDVVVERKQTKIAFSTGELSSFVVKKGKEHEFSAPTATLKDLDGNDIEADVTYSSSNPEIVSVDSGTGTLTFNDNGVWGTATITAEFAGNVSYEASKASYSIEYINKSQAKLSFGEDYDGKTITVYQGKENDFVSPVATLNPQNIGNIVYSSSDESVVTVNASGEVSFVSLGDAVVKAFYSGNDDYQEASASYSIRYVPQSIVFSKENNSFANVPGTESKNKKTVDFVSTDGNSYKFSIKNSKNVSDKLCISHGGTVTLSVPFGFLNGYKVVVDFEQSYSTSTNPSPLTMCYIDEGTPSPSVDAKLIKNNGGSSKFVATLDVPGDFVFEITAGTNQARVSSIEITPNLASELTFDEDADNQTVIAGNLGKVATVSLKRTLVADKWNTFCVPFDLDDTSAFFEGVEIKEYDDQKGVEGNTMYFKKVNAIVAGQPYLVKPKTDIVNPVFENVRIKTDAPQSVGSADYKFVGVFSPLTFDDGMSRKSLFLSSDGSLIYPDSGTTMRGMRAYFSFPGEMQSNIAKIVIDSDETAISDVVTDDNTSDSGIFNLNGAYVGNDESKLGKGIYIKNRKKVVVK